MKDLTGKTYGRLTVLAYHHSSNRRRYYTCLCSCGNEVIVRANQLTTGKTRSCGCLLAESREQNLKLGRLKKIPEPTISKRELLRQKYRLKHENPRLYRIWQSMKSRCYYQKNRCYRNYGGRGIRVCDEWLGSFDSFANWALSNEYADNLTIDRINNNGNYEPDNCRWITNAEQQKNKRPRQVRQHSTPAKS